LTFAAFTGNISTMKRASLLFFAIVFVIAILAISCGDKTSPGGIFYTYNSGGPMVIFNPRAKPLPIVPFPNDLITRYDGLSPTKLRLNLPLNARTELENNLRREMNTLDGFGISAPITVSFDKPLDPDTATDRNILVINLNENSENFGKPAKISFGSGVFPQKIKPFSFFENDPLSSYDNILYPFNVSEDYYSKNSLEPFYIPDENRGVYTIILRPLLPLEEETKYAVVLTSFVTDFRGNTVQSPFPYTNHIMQTGDILKLVEGTPSIINRLGFEDNQIAFAWTFTTQSVTRDLFTIRQGMSGKGSMSYLEKLFPPAISSISKLNAGCGEIISPFTIKADDLSAALKGFMGAIATLGTDIADVPLSYFLDFSSVDYFVFGSYKAPSFISNKGRGFQIIPITGQAEISSDKVTFFAAIPRETDKYKQPFPVMIFGHGNAESRLDAVAIANRFAKYGIATVGIDAVGHGPADYISWLCGSEEGMKSSMEKKFGIPKTAFEAVVAGFIVPEVIKPVSEALCIPIPPEKTCYTDASGKEVCESNWRAVISAFISNGLIHALACEGRASDTDNDTVPDSGGDFFTYDPLITRDNLRQTVVDQMQLVRTIKNLGAMYNSPVGLNNGDFNGDGILDIGGQNNTVFYSGQSLGGILGGILTAVEPDIHRSVLNVPGGGLTDIMAKSALPDITMRIFKKIAGPVITGSPGNDGFAIRFNNEKEPFATISSPLNGSNTVILANLTKSITRSAAAAENGRFWINIPADEADIINLKITNGSGDAIFVRSIAVDSNRSGMGYSRNSFEFEKLMEMSQMAIDASDPFNYAIHYNNLEHSCTQSKRGAETINECYRNSTLTGYPEKGVLVQVYAGDTIVPVSTGINIARAAGLIDNNTMREYISSGAIAGLINNYSNYFKSTSNIFGNQELLSPLRKNSGDWVSALRMHLTDSHGYFLLPEGTEDAGMDGCADYLENGSGGCTSDFSLSPYDPKTNPDPNNDNYCAATNSSGTENNLNLDTGEDEISAGGKRFLDSILEIDYTLAAQMQSILFFRYCNIVDNYQILLQSPQCKIDIPYEDCTEK